MYFKVQEALAEKIIPADLVVYLRASTDTLMKRIALRDRPYERQMEREYIDLLNRVYDDFYISSPQVSHVLTIETDELNIIERPDDLAFIRNRIREELRLAPYQPVLPIE
jgi:deoxyguanosine kinase